MNNTQVSIGEVKRDISALVNRVAYGHERIILTSRGKPKAALVSLEDYNDLISKEANDPATRWKAWLEQSDQLAQRILASRHDAPLDADALLLDAKTDLEQRHDFLRDD